MIKPLRFTDICVHHADVLAELHGESFEEGWSTKSLRTTLEMPGTFGFIAENAAGEPLGFGLFRTSVDEAEVLTIATRPSLRGQGIAKALMNRALAQSQKLGAKSMFLEVAVDNAAALKLYQSLGFEEVGRRQGYYKRFDGSRADGLVMKRNLVPQYP
ncbi:ribosomal protein S18-alanine N-acetyltransferase [Magnetovibrio sp. PR-2]|uniref:ribosomal protein S18-alanine N-acetyltransferase n=1 Tax=Magnetovibrio sp. PR-2 TaxID=3120356 RepID=UPI002FCE2856